MENIRERVIVELSRLISIPSYSGKERNILKYIEERLSSMGLDWRRQHVKGEESYNIICGNSEFVVSCHVDTVPPITMDDATVPRIEGGYIYGRGANDVKGQIAYTLVAIEEFSKEYDDLPVSVVFVVDEENNSASGSAKFSESISGEYKCLVLEPTSGRICTSQEGALEFRILAKGITAHGAESHRYFNPIKGVMDVIYHIEEALSRDVSIFHIKGGWEHYVVPNKCEVLAEVKIYRSENWENVERTIKDIIYSSPGEMEYIREDAENFTDFKKGVLYELLYESIEDVRGEKPEEDVMSSWTDAVNYHKKGAECIIFGYGNLEDAHTEREKIYIKDLIEGANVMFNLFSKVQALKISGKIK